MLGKVRTAVRDWGWTATILHISDRLLNAALRGRVRIYYYLLKAQPIPTHPMLPARRGRQFLVRELLPNDADVARIPRPAVVLSDRFAQGSRCVAAFVEGNLVGQLWWQTTAYREDEVRCVFSLQPTNRVVWDYDVYVDPEYRGSLLFAKLWDEAFAMLRAEGFEWSASRVSAWNTASLQSHGRLGARDIGKAIFFIVGPMQLMLASAPPYIHCSLGNQSRPTLRVAITDS